MKAMLDDLILNKKLLGCVLTEVDTLYILCTYEYAS